MPYRCAFGCKDTGKVMHSFPNPNKFPERFKDWVNLIGYTLETLTDYDIYKKKRICDIHFTDEHRNRFKRLNALAIPTLYLPGGSHSMTASAGQSEASLSLNHPTTSTSLPSTSSPDDNSGIATTTQQFEAICVCDPSSNTTLLASSTSEKSHCTAATNSVVKEHSYSVISRPTQKRLLKDAHERMGVRFNCMQMRPLQTKMKYLQNEIVRLRKKGQSFKARLGNAEKLSNKVAFQKVTQNMTKPTKQIFQTVKYIKKIKTGNKIRLTETTIPSVTNLIKTIEGMENLWKLLSRKYGLDVMLTRNFNQDPVENFFGNIRSYGARNNAPNTVAFEGAFKVLLLNNFNSPHSRGANCEEDSNECLQTLDFFFKREVCYS